MRRVSRVTTFYAFGSDIRAAAAAVVVITKRGALAALAPSFDRRARVAAATTCVRARAAKAFVSTRRGAGLRHCGETPDAGRPEAGAHEEECAATAHCVVAH